MWLGPSPADLGSVTQRKVETDTLGRTHEPRSAGAVLVEILKISA